MAQIVNSPITPTLKSQLRIFCLAFIVVMGSLVMGYFLVLVSILEQPIAKYNNLQGPQQSNQLSMYLSLATSLLPLGSLISSFLYKPLMNIVKSQNMMIKICDISIIILCIVNSFSLQLKLLTIIRFLLGFIIGISSIIVPTYLTSLSPTKLTGRIGALNQIFITIGIAIAYGTGFSLKEEFTNNIEILNDKERVWKTIVLLPVLFCIIRIAGMSYYKFDCLERHIKNGQNKKLKEYISEFYVDRSLNVADLIATKTSHKLESLQNQSQQSRVELQIKEKQKQSVSKGQKRRIMVAYILCFANQFCGINAIIFYANKLFNQLSVGNDSFGTLMSFYMGVFQIIITLISGAVMDKFGRRTLTIIGTSIITMALILGYIILDFVPNVDPKVAAIAVFIHIGGFSISLGPISILYVSQIITDVSPYLTILWIETVIISMTSSLMIEKIGIGKSFLVYGLLTGVSLFYLWKYMIETKGKTRGQIEQEYDDKKQQQLITYQKVRVLGQDEEQ